MQVEVAIPKDMMYSLAGEYVFLNSIFEFKDLDIEPIRKIVEKINHASSTDAIEDIPSNGIKVDMELEENEWKEVFKIFNHPLSDTFKKAFLNCIKIIENCREEVKREYLKPLLEKNQPLTIKFYKDFAYGLVHELDSFLCKDKDTITQFQKDYPKIAELSILAKTIIFTNIEQLQNDDYVQIGIDGKNEDWIAIGREYSSLKSDNKYDNVMEYPDILIHEFLDAFNKSFMIEYVKVRKDLEEKFNINLE